MKNNDKNSKHLINENELKKQMNDNKEPKENNRKSLNSVSVLLYSFSLTFIELIILDFALSNLGLLEYKLKVTGGIIIALIIIVLATFLFMDTRFSKIREYIFDSKINKYSTIIGIISTIIIANYFFRDELFYINGLLVIIIPIVCVLIGYIYEKINKKWNKLETLIIYKIKVF